MDNLEIRRVELADVNQLQKICRQTFFEAFSNVNTEEDIKKYLEEAFAIKKLTEEIKNEYSELYFGILNEVIIGYIKVNFGESQNELKDNNSLEIERIYILRDFQGKNVGQSLYEKALSIAQQKQCDFLWLGVWEHNPRAIKFYQRNGFVEFDKHIFMLGNDEQTDIMMKLQLK